MIQHYCDQTKQPIEGAAIKVIIQPPGNGYVLTLKENEIMREMHEKDFSSLNAMADYIKQHYPNL